MPSASHLRLPNLRDVGGLDTRDGGLVRYRTLYRSSAPAGLSASAIAELADMGLRAVFDLRSEPERSLAPDTLPEGAAYSGFDVLAGTSGLTPVDQERLMAHPELAGPILGGGNGIEISEERFRDLVRLPNARRGFGRVFASLMDDVGRPALIHCSTGKDRTGWAIAALLSLLEVPRESVIADYLISADHLAPMLHDQRRAFVARGGDGSLFDSLWGVSRENLDAAFDEVNLTYGTIEGYFAHGLGLDRFAQQALRVALVEPSQQ